MRRLLIVGALIVTAYGCRDTDVGVQILGVIPPDENCVFDPDSDIRLTGGLWDIGFGRDYQTSPVVANALVSRALDIQAEMNNVRIEFFEIELRTVDGTRLDTGDLPNPYSTRTNVVIPIGEGDVAATGVAVGPGIPSAYADVVSQLIGPSGFGEVVMSLQAVGNTAGGLEIKTIEFDWPVTVCRGVAAFNAPPFCLFNCSAGGSPTTCVPGQDGREWCPFPPEGGMSDMDAGTP